MSNCLITFEIINYEASNDKCNIPFQDLECIVRVDTFEGKISLNESNTSKIITRVNQVRRDIKINIKILHSKQLTLIGIFDLTIPYTQIKKTEINSNFSIEKKIPLTMIDSTKRILFGSIVKNANIYFNVLADVKVCGAGKCMNKSNSVVKKKTSGITALNKMPLSPKIEKNSNNKLKLDVETQKVFVTLKTPPSCEMKIKKNFFLEIDNNYNKTFSSKSKKRSNKSSSFSSMKKKKYEIVTSNGNNSNSHKKKKNLSLTTKGRNNYSDREIFNSESIKDNTFNAHQEEDELLLGDTTRIPSLLLNDEEETKIANIENDINQLSKYINQNYGKIKNNASIQDATELMMSQLHLFIQVNALMNQRIKEEIDKKNEIREAYMKVNEKHRFILKKKAHLNELMKKSEIQNNILVNRSNEFSIQITQPKIKKAELKLYQHLFNKFYFEYDILKFSETEAAKGLDEDIKKKYLLQAVRATVNSYGSVTSLIPSMPENEKRILKEILAKNNIKEIEETRLSTKMIENNKIKAITEEDEDQEEDDDEDNHHNHQLFFDENEKIEYYLTDVSQKKSKIPFKKISLNNYQYGTQKIIVKLENEEIKVKSGNSFVTLEKFIEVNESIEEGKLRNKALIKKAKGLGPRKINKKGFPMYQNKK